VEEGCVAQESVEQESLRESLIESRRRRPIGGGSGARRPRAHGGPTCWGDLLVKPRPLLLLPKRKVGPDQRHDLPGTAMRQSHRHDLPGVLRRGFGGSKHRPMNREAAGRMFPWGWGRGATVTATRQMMAECPRPRARNPHFRRADHHRSARNPHFRSADHHHANQHPQMK